MNPTHSRPPAATNPFSEALGVIERTVDKYRGCTPQEQERLRHDLAQLQEMQQKLTQGRVEIVLFGEISTGKSALINALIGQPVAEVDVQGGWTKTAQGVPWQETDYVLPSLDGSQLVLVDTPGINEVGDSDHETIAKAAVRRGDLILFVTDSDLNEVEYSAIVSLVGAHKPILIVLNKIDLYTESERQLLLQTLRDTRLVGLIPRENFVMVAADPREVEYVEQDLHGREKCRWEKPAAEVAQLKSRILEILAKDGRALIALNAAMYAADKSDRIARLRMELREARANQLIWSFAATKALAVGINAVPVADVIGGAAVDVAMVLALSRVYGLELSWMNAQRLVTSILAAAGLVTLTEWGTHLLFNVFKLATAGTGTVLTAVPQGAVAGFGSYIVGNAAKHYLEHGASWGHESPKAVVRRILDQTDKQSVLEHLKDEIKKKIQYNVANSERG